LQLVDILKRKYNNHEPSETLFYFLAFWPFIQETWPPNSILSCVCAYAIEPGACAVLAWKQFFNHGFFAVLYRGTGQAKLLFPNSFIRYVKHARHAVKCRWHTVEQLLFIIPERIYDSYQTKML